MTACAGARACVPYLEGDEACVPYLAVLKHAFHIWQVLKHAADVVKTRTIPPEVIAYWLDTIATPLSSYYTKPPTILYYCTTLGECAA